MLVWIVVVVPISCIVAFMKLFFTQISIDLIYIIFYLNVALRGYNTLDAFRCSFDSNRLLPPSGALVCCFLIPCVVLLKEAYSTEHVHECICLSLAGCLHVHSNKGKQMCSKSKPLCCSKTPHVSIYFTFALVHRQWEEWHLHWKWIGCSECPLISTAVSTSICVDASCSALYNLILPGLTVSIIPDESFQCADWWSLVGLLCQNMWQRGCGLKILNEVRGGHRVENPFLNEHLASWGFGLCGKEICSKMNTCFFFNCELHSLFFFFNAHMIAASHGRILYWCTVNVQ